VLIIEIAVGLANNNNNETAKGAEDAEDNQEILMASFLNVTPRTSVMTAIVFETRRGGMQGVAVSFGADRR
jgi:hypothetical protein